MAKEQNNNATVNNTPAQQPENQAPENNQENNQPAADQQGNNPAPKPEELQPPKKGVLKRIGGWVKDTTIGKIVAGTVLLGTGAAVGYVSGRVTGHTKGVMDTLSTLHDDDTQLGIEDKSSYEDVDVDISDVDTDISTIDI